jgi:hypothetical protein
MSSLKSSFLLADLTSRTKELKAKFSVEDTERFFSAVDIVMESVKALLATVDVLLDSADSKTRFGNVATPEPMEMSLSDVSTNTSGLGSVNTSGLLDVSAASESDMKDTSNEGGLATVALSVGDTSMPNENLAKNRNAGSKAISAKSDSYMQLSRKT